MIERKIIGVPEEMKQIQPVRFESIDKLQNRQ